MRTFSTSDFILEEQIQDKKVVFVQEPEDHIDKYIENNLTYGKVLLYTNGDTC